MPDAQFAHIVDTLRGKMPREIAPQAQQAINEIRAQLVEQLVSAGKGAGLNQWNATAFNRAATEMQGKLGKVFSEKELANIKTLHDAGYILNTPTAYPGAAAQAYNLWQRGAMTGLPSIGAAIGGTLGGGIGAGVGAGIGGAAAGVVRKGADASNAARLAEMLRNPGGSMNAGGMQFGLSPGMAPAPGVSAALIESLRKWQPQNDQRK